VENNPDLGVVQRRKRTSAQALLLAESGKSVYGQKSARSPFHKEAEPLTPNMTLDGAVASAWACSMEGCLRRKPVMRHVKPLLDGHPQGVSVSLDDALRVTCLIWTSTISPSSEWKKET